MLMLTCVSMTAGSECLYLMLTFVSMTARKNVSCNKNEGIKMACANCKIRAHYDKDPKSIIGRIWRFHINFCPGWKSYLKSLSEEERAKIVEKYGIK